MYNEWCHLFRKSWTIRAGPMLHGMTEIAGVNIDGVIYSEFKL